jgi:DNA-binding NarL/FixJ family response regulator
MIHIAIIQEGAKTVSALPVILQSGGDFQVSRTYYFMDDAIDGLRESPVDIVILDLDGNSREGVGWMRQIKSKIAGLKWLAYARHQHDEMVFDALRAGANGYMLKESRAEDLKNALRDLMGGGAPMPHCIMNKVLDYFYRLPGKGAGESVLSAREKEIMHFTSRGLMYKEIAAQLGIGRETVKKHLSKIYGKLHVQNKVEALNKFYGL